MRRREFITTIAGAAVAPGQILISSRVLMKVESAVKVEPVGEFALKGIRRSFGGVQCAGGGVVRTEATRPTSATSGPQRGNTITLTGL